MDINGLPYNEEAEAAVLGILLINSSMDELQATVELTANDFYLVKNKEIFKTMFSLYEANEPIDLVTVSTKLQGNDAIGGIEYLKNLASSVITSTNLVYYAKLVKEAARRRQYIQLSQNIQKIAYDNSQDIEIVSDEVEKFLLSNSQDDTVVTFNDLLPQLYMNLVNAYEHPGKIPGHKTGWISLDAKIGGMENGQLIIVAGRPGMGKSIFAQNIAEHIAFKEQKKAILFNLEMTNEQTGGRIASSQSWTKYTNYKFGTPTKEDFEAMTSILSVENHKNLFLCDKPDATLNYIKSVSRRVKNRHGEIGVIIVDYLQLVGTSRRRTYSRADEISEISRGLKLLAKELNCPIVALSQLSREVEKRNDNRPVLSDLRESGSIEQDADTVLLIYREDYYKDTPQAGIAEIIVAKLREGKTGTVKLSWQPQIMKFMELKEVAKLAEKKKQQNKQISL